MSIDRKHLVTGALLAFVAVTAVTLAVKETGHVRAVAAAESARTPAARTEPLPSPAPAPAEGTPDGPASPAAPEAPVPDPPRAAQRVAVQEAARTERTAPKAVASTEVPRPAAPPSTIYVTYFHATARCVSCLKIEDLTAAAMTTRFAGPIAEKRVVWRTLNVDEPENNHFVKDYGLYTKSVVVSEVRDGRQVRWKNLDQVWQLLGDPAAFQSYVEREVQAFLEKA